MLDLAFNHDVNITPRPEQVIKDSTTFYILTLQFKGRWLKFISYRVIG